MANDLYINDPKLQKTPIMPFTFIYLARPDVKFDPKYHVTGILDEKNPEHAKYLAALNTANDNVGQELLKGITKGRNAFRVKDICKAEEDDTGNPTGRWFLKATTKNKPVVVDANGNVIPDAILGRAFSGSKGRLLLSLKKSTVTNHKTTGLTLYLSKVQITELVEGMTAGSSDFDSVPGGFSAAPAVSNGNQDVDDTPDF
jgi:hypothetical protein